MAIYVSVRHICEYVIQNRYCIYMNAIRMSEYVIQRKYCINLFLKIIILHLYECMPVGAISNFT